MYQVIIEIIERHYVSEDVCVFVWRADYGLSCNVLYCFSEQAIALAILRLVEQEKAVVEGAGAVGVAAILENKLPELKGKR